MLFYISGVSPIDMLTVSMDVHRLNNEIAVEIKQKEELKLMIRKLTEENKQLNDKNVELMKFGIDSVLKREQKIKGLFKYYTGILYDRFQSLFAFLIPENFTLEYEKGRTVYF